VSLPHLLLVDDSEAILAFERAALAGHYVCSTATNGRDALEKVTQVAPDCVLLDLSMPEMDGDEVLARLKDEPATRLLPVIIISSERTRAEACLRNGAAAFLPKPIRADELVALVARVLEESRRALAVGGLAVLAMTAGGLEFAVPLEGVRTVLPQVATRPLLLGPRYLREVFELGGEPVFVLDVALRLGVEHAQPVQERKLVVVGRDQVQLALCVDEVRDPEEFTPEEIVMHDLLGGAEHGLLAAALIAMAKTARGPLPVVDPAAFLSKELVRRLGALRAQPVAR
jgi:CheY-like chemotaxis protein/chemotaxis signal transduction protein